jgi:hypothetical protein
MKSMVAEMLVQWMLGTGEICWLLLKSCHGHAYVYFTPQSPTAQFDLNEYVVNRE